MSFLKCNELFLLYLNVLISVLFLSCQAHFRGVRFVVTLLLTQRHKACFLLREFQNKSLSGQHAHIFITRNLYFRPSNPDGTVRDVLVRKFQDPRANRGLTDYRWPDKRGIRSAFRSPASPGRVTANNGD